MLLLGCQVVPKRLVRIEGTRVEVGALGDLDEEFGVPALDGFDLRRFAESLVGELADRVEHPESPGLPAPKEALLEQRFERVEVPVADRLGRLE